MDSLAAHMDALLESRVHDVKPALYWVHGTNDQVNKLDWAEKVVKDAGTSDTTVSHLPPISLYFSIFLIYILVSKCWNPHHMKCVTVLHLICFFCVINFVQSTNQDEIIPRTTSWCVHG